MPVSKFTREGAFVGFTFKFQDGIKQYLPLLLIGFFIMVHHLVDNYRSFRVEKHFGTALFFALFIYIALLIITYIHQAFRLKFVNKAPLISLVLVCLLAWELVTLKFGLLPLPFFPSPGAVFNVLITDWPTLFISALYSLRLLFIGYAIGILFGLPSGILLGWSPKFNYWLTPALRFIGPIPATAWIPLVMVIFPTSFLASIFLIALSSWFPITVMTWSGVSNVNKSYYEVAKTLGADEHYLIAKVALPAAMPSIFVGLFMGLGTAFVTLVVGEMLGVKAGLGWYIQWAQGWAEYVKVYAALIMMAVIFSGIITGLFKFRDKILVWQKGLIKW